MSRSAYFDKEAQDALVEGLNLVERSVRQTMGRAGRTVVMEQPDGKMPKISKDGVTVAKQISPKDKKIKLGADLAISMASLQLSACGDGTTGATVLGAAVVNTGVRQLELAENEINRTSLRRGIEKARDYVVSKIEEKAIDITTNEQLVNIATVSANGDEKLGKVVADAYQKVGKNGVVMVEETKERDIHLEFKEGMTFDKGWTSQFFVTNHEDQTVEFDKPYILLCNSKISNFKTLAELIQGPISRQQPIVIIAESFDSAVTQGLAMNIMRTGGQMKVACVEAPSYGDTRLNRLRDMAIYLGGKIGDDPMGIKFEAMSEADFGSCDKIIIKRDETIISGGHGDQEAINARIEALQGEIKALKENATWEKEALDKRLAALTTGVAVIKVGGSSEEEIAEMHDRLEDAQYAVKAALEEGYLPGGGTVLLRLSEEVKANVLSENEDEMIGITIFANALKAPFKAIVENAGLHADVIIPQVLAESEEYGYNVATMQIVNMLNDGIIDPAKVIKGEVLAASSIASVILTSSVVITEDPVENNGVNLNMTGMPMM